MGNLTIYNCTFQKNNIPNFGLILYAPDCDNSSLQLNVTECIFSSNQASSIIYIFDGHSVTMNHNKSIVSILISHNLLYSTCKICHTFQIFWRCNNNYRINKFAYKYISQNNFTSNKGVLIDVKGDNKTTCYLEKLYFESNKAKQMLVSITSCDIHLTSTTFKMNKKLILQPDNYDAMYVETRSLGVENCGFYYTSL